MAYEFDGPCVYLVGAGPGDPGLLTLRAVECLQAAGLVLYDKLVPTRLLDFAGPATRCVCVADLPGHHPQRWPHVVGTIRDAVAAGQSVVRLKGGDPLIFGRGGEEAEELRRLGIRYEVVPGVTAALAAGAFADIPLTHRQFSSAVTLVAGHENPTKPTSHLDWPLLAKLPGTLAIYMGYARLELIAATLIEHGKPPDTPAALVAHASSGNQQTVVATLAELPDAVRAAGASAPAVVFVGPVVSARPSRSWFERLPLAGHRVLVARPAHQQAGIVRRLETLGAIPYRLPTVEILPLADFGPLDAALSRLAEFDWLAFTSPNGVRAFFDRLAIAGRDVRAVGHVKLACIGPGTADALAEHRLRPDVVPAVHRSEEFADALAPHVAGQRVLLPRADRGRDVLPDRLRAVATVEQVAAYRQVDAALAASPVLDAFRRGEIDLALLSSSNIARALLGQLDETCCDRIHSGTVRLVCISPVTAAAVEALGFPVAAVAREFTPDGMVRAAVELVAGSQHVAEGVDRKVDEHSAGQDAHDVDHAERRPTAERDAEDQVE